MPMEISRPAKVYRLWDTDDLRAAMETHAETGWVVQHCAAPGAEPATVSWDVRIQKRKPDTSTTDPIIVPTDHILVSDCVVLQTFTSAEEYNAANPDYPLLPDEVD